MERKNSFIALIYIWLPRVFGCHQKPERSFRYHGKQFPLCARCTGELTGILICAILFWFWHPSLIISVIMMIPMLIDGFTQRLTTYESTNIRRFITGFLFGIGLTSLFLLSVSYTFSNGYKYGNKIGKAVNYSAIKLPSIWCAEPGLRRFRVGPYHHYCFLRSYL